MLLPLTWQCVIQLTGEFHYWILSDCPLNKSRLQIFLELCSLTLWLILACKFSLLSFVTKLTCLPALFSVHSIKSALIFVTFYALLLFSLLLFSPRPSHQVQELLVPLQIVRWFIIGSSVCICCWEVHTKNTLPVTFTLQVMLQIWLHCSLITSAMNHHLALIVWRWARLSLPQPFIPVSNASVFIDSLMSWSAW